MRKNLHNLFICQWSLHKSMDSQNLDEEKWKLRVYLQAEDASFLVTYSPKHAKKRGESRVWFRSCYFTPSNDLVRKGIVRHCKRLPLALEVVGRSLHAQPVEVWRSRLMKLSEGQSVIDSEADLRKCFQSSLDALNDEDVMLKECFLDLGSLPEGQKVPATALIDKDGVDAIANLQKLSSWSLLNLVVTRYTDLLFVFKLNDRFSCNYKHKTPYFGGCGEEILMSAELVGGSALGAGFGKLITAVLDARKKITQFDSSLKKLEERLNSITPSIVEVKKFMDQSNHPRVELEKLIQILKDGEKLIHKCSEVSSCDYFNNWSNRGVSDNYESLGSCEATDPPAFMVGLDVPLKELKRRLFTDGESRIVVSAPGGCGKTTLAKRLCHDQQVKEYFTDICYVTVSKTCDLIGIIKKLFWHNAERVQGFQSEEDAVNQLELMLKRKVESGRILLVLDDVWSGSKSVPDKFKFQISKFKVLVTSRNEFPGFGSTYNLKLLNEEDAKTLFCHSAIPEDGMPSEELVNGIVRRCKGFPLALEVVGRSLHEQPVEIWRSTLMKLSEGESIVNSEDELRNCLQSSLDALDDKDIMLKECFMDLGSFPEDQKIPATALIDMWAELHKLDKGGIYAISNLHKLCSRNLLNLVVTRNDANEIDWCYNDAFVMQHDLLRDLAIYQSEQEPIEKRKRLIVDLTGNRLPEWWTKEKQPRSSARLVSISTDEMFSSSWCSMQLPEAEALILNFNQTEKKYELPEFMKQMDELKVLVVTNYGFCTAELTNFSVLGSLSNLKRIRLEKVSIPTLCKTSIELKNLEKLSLVMCHKIGLAFASIPSRFQKCYQTLGKSTLITVMTWWNYQKGFVI
ncbi:unnamed protein product, partial [Vitis vinifera]